MNSRKIVITGGPSTGKTSVINALEKKGFWCLHEVIRTMTLEQKHLGSETEFKTNPIVSVADPLAFNQMILKARLAQYEKAITFKESIVFFDRGIPDVLAYMDCFDQVYGAEFEDAARSNPYDLIFLMPPWREIHVVDNERFESFEESLLVNTCLLNRYTALGYDVQIVPKNTVADRVDFILDFLNKTM